MALRTAHGAMKGSGPRVETLPPDEQPTAAGLAGPLATARDAGGRVRGTAAARALAKLPRRSPFLARKLTCDPRFEPHNHTRLEWLKGRRNELAAMTGGVSRGVGAMLASAAWLYAAGEFMAERGAETGDADLFKAAASLTATARQHDLAAWELSTREGKVRAEAATPETLPWFVPDEDAK